MSTLVFVALLWVVMATCLGLYVGLVALADRAHRVMADREWGQRGGTVGTVLAIIGGIVVVGIILGAACGACLNGDDNNKHSLGRLELVSHHDDGGYDDGGDYQGRDDDGGYEYRRGGNGSQGDCQSGGCGNRSRRCDRSTGDCRSSFSPGPFKDSPVTIWFCPQPNSCNQGQQPPPEERQR